MNTLEQLRAQIDAADTKLLEALAERMKVVGEIGVLKQLQGLDSLDPERFKKVLATRIERGSSLGLSPEYVEKLYEVIHEYALSIERAH